MSELRPANELVFGASIASNEKDLNRSFVRTTQTMAKPTSDHSH
jgi:hypothetical protein